jgi:demethylmenaquinone methyltransferase/2-methoxy-6-polyprenyl-1,4-benzoquinol methylase
VAKAVQKLFSSIAPRYDFLNHFMSLSVDRRWRGKALSNLVGLNLNRVLDLCAGTLDLSIAIRELFPDTEIHAVDFALPMLEQGLSKLPKKHSIHLTCADGHHLPFPEKGFDAVVCAFGIRNLENHEGAAGEIRRVLKPGGTLVVLEFFRPEKILPKLFYQTYGKYIIPRVGGWISKNRKAYEYLQDSIQNFLSIGEYASLLSDFGFNDIKCRPLSGGIAHEVVAK